MQFHYPLSILPLHMKSTISHLKNALQQTHIHTMPTYKFNTTKGIPSFLSGNSLHHQTKLLSHHLTQINKLTKGTDLAQKNLFQLVEETGNGGAGLERLAGSAGMAWSLDFWLQGLNATTGPNTTTINKTNNGSNANIASNGSKDYILTSIERAICKEWGRWESFEEEFKSSAINIFASGWTWLVKDSVGKLSILNTYNGTVPFSKETLLCTGNDGFDIDGNSFTSYGDADGRSSEKKNILESFYSYNGNGSNNKNENTQQKPFSYNRSRTTPTPSLYNKQPKLPFTTTKSVKNPNRNSDLLIPVLALNGWEHSFIWDYGCDREKYVNAFWNVINWNRVAVIMNLQ